MNQNAKHTQGKLRVGDAGHTLFGPSNGSPSPETIASGIRNGDNARRLAHCWNCHDELVEALTDLESIAGLINGRQHAGCDIRPDDWSELYHQCQQARATLAKARGEQS